MRAAAQFIGKGIGVADADVAHHFAVFLAKQGDCTAVEGFLQGALLNMEAEFADPAAVKLSC